MMGSTNAGNRVSTFHKNTAPRERLEQFLPASPEIRSILQAQWRNPNAPQNKVPVRIVTEGLDGLGRGDYRVVGWNGSDKLAVMRDGRHEQVNIATLIRAGAKFDSAWTTKTIQESLLSRFNKEEGNQPVLVESLTTERSLPSFIVCRRLLESSGLKEWLAVEHMGEVPPGYRVAERIYAKDADSAIVLAQSLEGR